MLPVLKQTKAQVLKQHAKERLNRARGWFIVTLAVSSVLPWLVADNLTSVVKAVILGVVVTIIMAVRFSEAERNYNEL